jgi:1-phosphofructokinase family hexose kinase
MGDFCESFTRDEDIDSRFFPTDCGVRLNIKVIDSEGGCTELNEKGGPVKQNELDSLLNALYCDISRYDTVSLCGSIPQGVEKSVYKQILSRVSERKIYTVLDCDGEALEKGITARPGLIKPNRRELAGLLGLEEQDLQKESDLCDACAKLYENYGCSVICTLDSHGSVYIGDGGNFRVGIVPVPLRGFVGAGDTFLSSFLFARCAEERELPDALRFAAAAASAKVALEGTVLPTRAEIDALYSPAIPVDRI